MNALPFLLLSLVPGADLSGPDRPADARVAPVHVLATLTEAEALQVQGQPALFLIEPDSEPDEHDGQAVYDCVSADHVHRTVFLDLAQPCEDIFRVEATLMME